MSACCVEVLPVSAEVLLAVFDMPVSFHRCLVPITGGAAAALMLSQAIWMTQNLPDGAQGWLGLSEEEWRQEVGLSRAEQRGARRVLRGAGFLEERRCTFTHKVWIRVRHKAIWEALSSHGNRSPRTEVAQ